MGEHCICVTLVPQENSNPVSSACHKRLNCQDRDQTIIRSQRHPECTSSSQRCIHVAVYSTRPVFLSPIWWDTRLLHYHCVSMATGKETGCGLVKPHGPPADKKPGHTTRQTNPTTPNWGLCPQQQAPQNQMGHLHGNKISLQ